MKKFLHIRKKTLLVILFLFYFISGFAQIPTSGLVACYPFNGNANDNSGNGNNGTVSNAFLTTDRFSRLNNAYSFNGSNAYISLNPVSSFVNGNFTWAAWVKVTALPSSGNAMRIISIGISGGMGAGEQNLSLFNNYNGTWRGFGYSGNNSNACYTGSLPSLNVWYHVAVSRSNTQAILYVNGVQVSTATSSSQATYGTSGTRRAHIGAHNGFTQYFNGVIDDVQFYNRALSSTEVLALYNGGAGSLAITVNPGNVVCQGENVTFTATPTNITNPTYLWLRNGTVVGGNSTIYTTNTLNNNDVIHCLALPQGSACEVPVASNAITMTVVTTLPLTVIVTSSPGDTICRGDTVEYTAVPNNGGGSPSYQWKINDINVGTNQNTLTVDTLSNGAQVKCVVNSSSPCVTGNPATSNTVTMVVDDNLPLEVTIEASPGNIICVGGTVTFTAEGMHGGVTEAYQWKVNNINVGGNQQTISFDTLRNGDVVSCVYSSESICVTNNPVTSNLITMVVKEFSALDFNIIADPGTTICKGSSVQFIAEIIGLPANGDSCVWKINGITVGTSSDTLIIDTLTTSSTLSCLYWVEDNCYTNNPATKEIQLTILPSPVISVMDTIAIGTSETIMINTSYSGGTQPYQFSWTPETYLSDPHIAAPYASPLADTRYIIEIVDVNGCSCTDSVLIRVFDFNSSFFIPNIFSPNNDLQNDVLYVRGKGIKEMQFTIYDRWGKQVFTTTSQENGWDGTLNGKELNPATFIYHIKVTTSEGKTIEKTGNVTLVK